MWVLLRPKKNRGNYFNFSPQSETNSPALGGSSETYYSVPAASLCRLWRSRPAGRPVDSRQTTTRGMVIVAYVCARCWLIKAGETMAPDTTRLAGQGRTRLDSIAAELMNHLPLARSSSS